MNGFGNLRHPGGAYAVSRYVNEVESVILLCANSEHGLVKKSVAGIRAIPVVGIVTAVMDVAGWRQVGEAKKVEKLTADAFKYILDIVAPIDDGMGKLRRRPASRLGIAARRGGRALLEFGSSQVSDKGRYENEREKHAQDGSHYEASLHLVGPAEVLQNASATPTLSIPIREL